ncbi:mucin-2-like isoform X2 [Halichondria panicea]|uniref:mucin-2-like isoform X2 n=1 Tax=Halichondria panicea TaxID=6063 RepID=UPI00312B5A6A
MRRFILLLLLATPLCSGYQVYIDSTDLEEYFTGTLHFSDVQGRTAVIIENGTSQIKANGSLYLVSSSGTKDKLLPPLPRSVDSVTVTWLAGNSSKVMYSLSVDQDPSNFFASQQIISINATGDIPSPKSVFTLNVTCGSVPGEGDLMIDLTSTVNNSMQLLTSFLITKDCGSLPPTSSLSAAMSPTLSPTSAVLTSAASNSMGYTAAVTASFVLSSVSLESMTANTQTQTAGLSSVFGFDSSSTGATIPATSSVIFTPTPSNLLVTSSIQLFSSDLIFTPAPTNSQPSLTSSLTFSPAQTNAPSLTSSIHASSPPVTMMSSSPGMLISPSQSSEIVSKTIQSSVYYSPEITSLVYTTSFATTKSILTEVPTLTQLVTEATPEIMKTTSMSTRAVPSTAVPTKVLTSTQASKEVLTSTEIPTEVPKSTNVLTSTAVPTEMLTSTAVPTEMLTLTSTAVSTEMLTSTAVSTEMLTSTAVPTKILTSTAVPTEMLTLTSTAVSTEMLTSVIPTEMLASTAVPTKMLTPTAVSTEMLTSTAVPTEMLTSTAVPTEMLTPTAVSTEMLTSTAVPTEMLTPTAVTTEMLTSTVVSTEMLTSVIPTEMLTSTVVTTEMLTPTAVTTEMLTSTAVSTEMPTEMLTPTAVSTEMLTPTAVSTEMLTSTAVSTEMLTSTAVSTEILTSTVVTTELLNSTANSTPVPTKLLTSTPVPTKVLTSTAIPTEFVTSTSTVLTPSPTFVSSPVITMSSSPLDMSTILSTSMSSFIESSLLPSSSISSFVTTLIPLLSSSASTPSAMPTFTNVPMSHSVFTSSYSRSLSLSSGSIPISPSLSSSGVPVPSLTLAAPSVTMSRPLSISSLPRSLSLSQISDFVMSTPSFSSLIVSTPSLLMSSSMLSPSSTVSFLSSSSGSTSEPTGTDLTPSSPVLFTLQLTNSRHPLSTNSLPPGASPEPNETDNGTGIPTKEPELMTILLIAFAPVVAILLLCIILIFCCICCIRRKKKKTKHFNDDPADLPVSIAESNFVLGADDFEASTKKTEAPISLWTSLPWGVVSTLPKVVQGTIHPYTVDRRSLSILSTIHRGTYGCIVNGQMSVDRTDLVDGYKGVMMKMLIGFQQNTGHHQEIAKFLEYATIMRDLDHPNISKVMNVSVEDNLAPLVLYPIVEYGNLHTFLTFCRVSPNESPLNADDSPEYRGYVRANENLPVTFQYKVNFGLQVAYAMKYLSDKGVVHPDLALRNCLLDTNYLVKVSDGALSQEFFPNCYHVIKGALRPVRWAAPETFAEGLCTSQSNVWSYAVTLWEIMTKAEFPYREVDNNRSIPSHLMMGARLEQPPDCPNYLYELMQACWESKAEQRPNFGYLHSRIEQINQQLAMVQDESPLSTRVDGQLYSRENSQASLDHPSSHQSRRKRSGRSSLSKNSPSIMRRSINSRVSAAGSEHLSLTFSVLSGDLSGESSSEGEEGPEMLSPLAESVVYQMIPSLLKDDPENDVKHLPTTSPMNLVNSFLDSSNKNTIELKTSNYAPTCIPSTLISPAPTTPSTVTTRLTPWETNSYTSSQFAPSTLRSDDSASTQRAASSPSPDLTSKSSMFGEDTNSNPRFSYISHSNADTVSKASISESVGASNPGMDDCPQPPPNQNSNMHTHSNGHPKINGAVLNHSLERIADAADSSEVNTNDINDYEGTHSDTKSSVKPPTGGDRTSLGLTDLSSDLMATFDSWNL